MFEESTPRKKFHLKMYKAFQFTNFRCLIMTKKTMEADAFAPSAPINTPLVSKLVFLFLVYFYRLLRITILSWILIFDPAKAFIQRTIYIQLTHS